MTQHLKLIFKQPKFQFILTTSSSFFLYHSRVGAPSRIWSGLIQAILTFKSDWCILNTITLFFGRSESLSVLVKTAWVVGVSTEILVQNCAGIRISIPFHYRFAHRAILSSIFLDSICEDYFIVNFLKIIGFVRLDFFNANQERYLGRVTYSSKEIYNQTMLFPQR